MNYLVNYGIEKNLTIDKLILFKSRSISGYKFVVFFSKVQDEYNLCSYVWFWIIKNVKYTILYNSQETVQCTLNRFYSPLTHNFYFLHLDFLLWFFFVPFNFILFIKETNINFIRKNKILRRQLHDPNVLKFFSWFLFKLHFPIQWMDDFLRKTIEISCNNAVSVHCKNRSDYYFIVILLSYFRTKCGPKSSEILYSCEWEFYNNLWHQSKWHKKSSNLVGRIVLKAQKYRSNWKKNIFSKLINSDPNYLVSMVCSKVENST